MLSIMKILTVGIFVLFVLPISYTQENKLVEIANQEFNRNVSAEYRSEYTKFEMGSFPKSPADYQTLYYFKWTRTKNNIPIVNDYFLIKIYDNGNVLNKEFTYSILTPQLDAIPILTVNQAQWIAEKYYGKIRGLPELQIIGRELTWFIRLENNVEIGVNADTGESRILAVPLGIRMEPTPTSFNPTQYFLETQLPWILGVLAIIGGAGMLYYKK